MNGFLTDRASDGSQILLLLLGWITARLVAKAIFVVLAERRSVGVAASWD